MKKYFIITLILNIGLGSISFSQPIENLMDSSKFAYIDFILKTGSNDGVYDLSILKNNKILIGSYSNNESGLIQLNSNGTFDETFGLKGYLKLASIKPKSFSIQNDDKIVVAGQNSKLLGLQRFLIDGVIDNSFGINGSVSISSNGDEGNINSIVCQSDNKAISAGYSKIYYYEFIGGYQVQLSVTSLAIIRTDINGTIDPTFANSGKYIMNFGWETEAKDILLQADGKILVGGYVRQVRNGNIHFLIARFLSDGNLDNTFGNQGKTVVSIEDQSNIESLALQPDGKIIAAGYSVKNSIQSLALTRLQQNGSIDNEFGVNGVVIKPFTNSDAIAKDIVIQNDEKILLAGSLTQNGKKNILLTRFTLNGNVDETYNSKGYLILSIGKKDDFLGRVKIDSNNNILCAGTVSNEDNNIINPNTLLVRMDSDGNKDLNFGIAGIVNTDIGELNGQQLETTKLQSQFESVITQSDGSLILGGTSTLNNKTYQVMSCIDSNINLVNNFGTEGKLLDNELTEKNYLLSINNKILSIGTIWNQSKMSDIIFIKQFNKYGNVDTSFNHTGTLLLAIDSSSGHFNNVKAIIAVDHKIIVSAVFYYKNSYYSSTTLFRFDSCGILDQSFGLNGILKIPQAEYTDDISIQSSKKLILLSKNKLIRFNYDGSNDPAFGSSGSVSIPFVTKKIIIDQNDKIIAGGMESWGDSIYIIRYNKDGDIDISFGIQGTVLQKANIPSQYEFDYDNNFDIKLLTDNKIVILGKLHEPGWSFTKPILFRFSANGILDANFGAFICDSTFDGPAPFILNVCSDGGYLITGTKGNGYLKDYGFFCLKYSNKAKSLSVSINTLTIASQANSSKTFNITSNIAWQATSNQTWLSLSSTSGSSNATILLTASANLNTSSRTAIVTISGTGVSVQTITVTQDGAANFLTISSNTLSIGAPANSTITFDITSNIGWTAASNQTWLTLSSVGGSNNETITLTAAANPSLSTRIATITVSGTNVSDQTITVSQDAGATGIIDISSNPVIMYPNPVTNELTIKELSINSTISIFDVNGKLLINRIAQSIIEIIDVSSLSNGVYSIKVTNDEVVKTSKLIKE